ncbi:MAG: ethanolamine ammonia-lyase reactivating factor EutA [Hyphomicrobiaceae bacterium]
MTDVNDDEPQGGRIFFSSVGRSLEGEDEIRLTSVGVDIGSSTSHLVFSRLVLERLDNRYVVSSREVLHESDVLLTPYAADTTIDADRLGAFVDAQYAAAGISPDEIDTGALILTGVAVRRANARAIAELFAAQAGKFVSVSAGDALETTLAAFGSGAVARSIRDRSRVMNIDIGGGTSKVAVCESGDVTEITAIDVGARVIALGADRTVERIEEAGRRFAAEIGLDLRIGQTLSQDDARRIAERMADRLFEAVSTRALTSETSSLLRLDPLPNRRQPVSITFSGGVSEYIYGREPTTFGDLGPLLGTAIRKRIEDWRGVEIAMPDQGIRATVVGASQYTVQVSGSTIFVTPADTLPLRSVPAITPDLPLEGEDLSPDAIAEAIHVALRRLDLHEGEQPVALCYRWQGSATWARLDDFCAGAAKGLKPILDRGHPLVLVGDSDVGGLVGIHAHEEAKMTCPVVSIDGINLKEFDFIDIGAILPASGAVPVVIKSLVFPTTAALGKAEA